MSNEETVFVKTTRAGGNSLNYYHTDRHCRLLAKAGEWSSKSRDVLYDDLEECPACEGTIDHGGTDDPFGVRDKLLAADPNAVGDSA